MVIIIHMTRRPGVDELVTKAEKLIEEGRPRLRARIAHPIRIRPGRHIESPQLTQSECYERRNGRGQDESWCASKGTFSNSR